MKTRLVSLLLGLATFASAHFVFVVPQPGGKAAQVFISETLKPSDEVDAGMVSGAKLSLREPNGHETALALSKGNQALVINLIGTGTRLIHGMVDLGFTQQGAAKPYILVYYPKTILGDAFDSRTVTGASAPIEIVPVAGSTLVRLKVLAHGKPLDKSEVTVLLPDGNQKKLTTDANGLTEELTQTGRYGAWARYWEAVGGERDGKPYAETRNYATLVFDLPAQASESTGPGSPAPAHFATLPEAASSFGAVVSGGWLYVYGGHIAVTHTYSTNAVSGQFNRLNLSSGRWEKLPGGKALQGMNLAADDGKIYLIGGMAPRNEPGKPSDTHSVADCAMYDPASGTWQTLPPLPQPRSSHDVVVIDHKLYVTGGWTLEGSRQIWQTSTAVLDLRSKKLEWKDLGQPYKRRALIAAAYKDKMYVLGGFDEKANVIHEMAIYDPKNDQWTKGPDLPGDEENAFAPAACVHQNELILSTADGVLYRLNEGKQQWDKVGSATPRIAHRIASDGKSVLVIGGAGKGKNFDLIESVAIQR
jgi:N-acetylneuraminic acid mutarotase